MLLIGFARVTINDQDLTVQLAALRAAGRDKIFYGKDLGATNENEQQLEYLIDYISDGDLVLVTKFDCQGRSLKMVLLVIDSIHANHATLKCLDGMVDTSNNFSIATAIVNIIATLAQLERDFIASRTSGGRARAITERKHIGRKSAFDEKQTKAVVSELKQDTVMRQLAREYRVSRATIYRFRDKYI